MPAPSEGALRPWFISITAKWAEADQFDDFRAALVGVVAKGGIPFFHMRIPKRSWHSTIFAVCKLANDPPAGASGFHEAGAVWNYFKSAPELVSKLQQACAASTSMHAKPMKLRCFDDALTVQFEDSDTLSELRSALSDALLQSVTLAQAQFPGVESLLGDRNKSVGGKLFGSIRRSASPDDRSILRWERSLDGVPSLTLRRVHFLVSDDALTNTHTANNDFPLTLGAA